MKQILIVGAAGFVGSVFRYKLSGLVFHHTPNWRFPLGTVLVNVSGCLIAGILAAMAEKHDLFSANTRLFLFVGLLGGYTTFSAFGLETIFLVQRQEHLVALGNVLASVIFGLIALWCGIKIAS